MPLKSEAQRRFLHAAEERGEVPAGLAHKFEHATPKAKKARLPMHVKKHATVLDLLNKEAAPPGSVTEVYRYPPSKVPDRSPRARAEALAMPNKAAPLPHPSGMKWTAIPDVKGGTTAIQTGPGGTGHTPSGRLTSDPGKVPVTTTIRHGHGAPKTAQADRSKEKYEGVDSEGKVKNDEDEDTEKSENYFGHGKGKDEKPSIGRGAAVGAGVGGATGLTLGTLINRGSEHATPAGKVVERVVKALPHAARLAVPGAAIGLVAQAIRRADYDDEKEKTAMEMRPFDKLAGRKDGMFFKDQPGSKSGMFMKEANAAMGYGPGGMTGTNPAAAPPTGAQMGHGKSPVGPKPVIDVLHGHGAKKITAGAVAKTAAASCAMHGHSGMCKCSCDGKGTCDCCKAKPATEKKAEPNTQVDGADRTTRDYTGPLAAPRNALFGVGEGVHGTNESSKLDSATAAQLGHDKMKKTALSLGDLKDVLSSAGTGAQQASEKIKEVGLTAAEKAKEIAASAGTGAQQGVDYLKEHPVAALGATGGAAYLGAKGLMRGGKAIAGVPGRLLKRKPKVPVGLLGRLRQAVSHAR